MMKRTFLISALTSFLAVAACLIPVPSSQAQVGPVQRFFGGGYYRNGYATPVYNGYSPYGYGPYVAQDNRYSQRTIYAAPVVRGYRYGYPNEYQQRPVYRGLFNRGYGVSDNFGANYNPYGYGYYDTYGF